MNRPTRRALLVASAVAAILLALRAPAQLDAQEHSGPAKDPHAGHVMDPHAGHKMPAAPPDPTSQPADDTAKAKAESKATAKAKSAPKPAPEVEAAGHDSEPIDHTAHADHADHADHTDQTGHAHAVEPAPAAPPAHAGAEVWTCPMHPTIVQEGPGTCPICGMDLVAKSVEPDTSAGGRKGVGAAIGIDPVVVQNMGIRTALVRRGSLSRTIRTVGSVVAAEDRLSVVNLRFSGWIEKIFVDETGVKVNKGQHLFEVFSPELVTAQQEYLLALRTSGPGSGLAKSARRRLHYLGIPDWQIERVKDGKEVRPTLVVAAPRNGYVVHKNVLAGARVSAGQDLYRIADLSSVWVDTEVYEFDAPWVRVGSPARVELTYQAGQHHKGEVSFIHPTLDARTRTLRVRVELDNDELALKPGMFATVEIEAERKTERLVIPTESVLHSGLRKLVFVALALGRYEAREFELGLVGDNHVTEVLGGLQQGERVVTSGQFMLDSESQLREAVQKMLDARLHAKDPDAAKKAASSSPADDSRSGDTSETYWTCPMHPQIVQDGPGTCPICGMDLVEKKR